MNAAVAAIIRDKISSLDWIEKISGLVKPLVKVDRLPVPGDATKYTTLRKTFPVSCDITYAQCQQQNRYLDLMPNAKLRSLAYFEDGGCQWLKHEHGMDVWKSQLTLVVWVNMNLFQFSGCYISPLLISSLHAKIPVQAFNSGPFNRMQIFKQGELPKTPRIFSSYSYQEEHAQYLMFPFDYFALQFSTEFHLSPSCADEVVIKTADDCPSD